MRLRQGVAVVVCVVIVAAAYATWYFATSKFNPNPQSATIDTTGSCSPAAPPCPAFKIDKANLTIREVSGNEVHGLYITVSALGPTQASSLGVFFSGIPIGNVTNVVPAGKTMTTFWPVPPTLNVTAGETYRVYAEAVYLDPGSGRPVAEYWSSTLLTAVKA